MKKVQVSLNEIIEFFQEDRDCKIEIYEDGTADVYPLEAYGRDDKVEVIPLEAYDLEDAGSLENYKEWLQDGLGSLEDFEIEII